MDPSDFPVEKSPRRELQGPRPTPLKIRKDSYKIKKPPVVPQPSQLPPPVAQPRPPVIIYAVSPKVIHTTASDFMTLVQRLTGSSSSSTSSFSSSPSPLMSSSMGGALSPAARIATIEKARSYEGEKTTTISSDIMDQLFDIDANVDKGSSFPGILSPVPSSLPPISPNFFSPSLDTNPLNFLHDLSPIFSGNKNYIDGTFMSSPTAFLSTPINSPTLSFDLFNQFFD